MQQIRMNIVSARDLGDRRLRRQRLLDQAQLLRTRPPTSFAPGQKATLARDQLLGMRPSPLLTAPHRRVTMQRGVT